MSHSWRDSARPIIARVLAETEHKTPNERKQALFDAYPFGMRKYHPYKIWLDEIQRQTGKKAHKEKVRLEDEGQLTFAEVYGTLEIKWSAE